MNITSIKDNKQVVKHHEFGPSKTQDTKAMHHCRSIAGHKLGNTFLCGGENTHVSLLRFDLSLKEEPLHLEAIATF